jgi:ABC-type multidrug transport system ATPase subunit
MEEAEALADRVAILAHGRLQCIGAPTDLKARFGKNYRVAVKTASETDLLRQKIVARFPHCEIADDLSRIDIPLHSAALEDLFEYFESLRPEDDSYFQYTVSASSLEQVFLSLGKES